MVGVGARNAHALMRFSVSYLFPADILFLEQQNGRFVAQVLVTRPFLGSYMPYRSLKAAVRRIYTLVGNSLKVCLAASVQVLECFFLLCAFVCQIRSALTRALQHLRSFQQAEILERSSSIS